MEKCMDAREQDPLKRRAEVAADGQRRFGEVQMIFFPEENSGLT